MSEITLKELVHETDYLRIDSEFHLKEYKNSLSLISSKTHSEFVTHIELLTDGKHGGVTLTEQGIIFLRTTNIKENLIDLSDLRFISEEESNETKRAEFNEGDLLITTIGTIGLCAKVPKGFPRGTINQNLVRVVLKNKKNASIFCAFFNSRYGRNQLLRWGAGNVYQMINYPNLRLVLVPDFSDSLSANIDEIYQTAFSSREKSTVIYNAAETLLLETLGLQNFKPSTEAVNIKSFKDSFGTSGRLDAEYYQPKYEELIAKIKSQPFEYLKNLVNISKSIEPGSEAYQETGIPFVRVSNLSKFGLSQPDIHLDKEDFSFMMKPKNNTILLSKDGSVGIAYKVSEDLNVVTSGAILHLTMKVASMFPDYLTLVLNSKITQMQAERDAGGSIIQHWKPSEISQVIIPIVEINVQQKIAALIQESFRLKAESERLLELAKRAVEMAIEHDETVAIDFINERQKGL